MTERTPLMQVKQINLSEKNKGIWINRNINKHAKKHEMFLNPRYNLIRRMLVEIRNEFSPIVTSESDGTHVVEINT
jgi:hypothetical protein